MLAGILVIKLVKSFIKSNPNLIFSIILKLGNVAVTAYDGQSITYDAQDKPTSYIE